jgi:ABC-type nitrate/sulfonate/bicarbonate transport system substrate-binding protein
MDALKVVVFEGVQNLPIFAAIENGFFRDGDLEVNLTFTPDSQTLRSGLARGAFQIAHTAVDNAVAMVELAGDDVTVVMGGDNGFNSLVVQSPIEDVAQLRGKTVLVDAPNTAFALVLYKILAMHGLGRGDYQVQPVGATPLRLERMVTDRDAAAAIMNLPFLIHGQRAGLRTVCRAVDVIGPYLSTAGFTLRVWARENSGILIRYIRAYVEGLRWVVDPSRRRQAEGLLVTRLHLPADVAREAYDRVIEGGGFMRDAAIDVGGFANVMALRAEIEGQWRGVPPIIDKYVDSSFHAAALQAIR